MNWYHNYKKAQNIIYETKSLDELSTNEKLSLYRLTLGKNIDQLYDQFFYFIKNTDDPEIAETVKVILAKDSTRNRVVGWALLNQPFDKEVKIFVYVAKQYRRKGIGTELVNRAKQQVISSKNIPSFIAHDDPSRSFYSSIPGLSQYTEIY